MNKLLKKGFTLIELLVVIAIVGILSGFIVISMSGAINTANDAKRKIDIDTVRKAVVYYKAQNASGLYPIESTKCTLGGGTTPCSNLASALSSILPAFPIDPVSGYYEYVSADGTDFSISSTLSSNASYSYTASKGFSTGSAYTSTCAAATNSQVSCTETTIGSDIVYTFTYSSAAGTTTWTPPTGVSTAEVLVVAGGGAGGYATGQYGGGGGAGGLVYASAHPVSGQISITVGAGGAPGGAQQAGLRGGNSVFDNITALGGGGGGTNYTGPTTGGSGGGACDNAYTTGAAATQGNSADGIGYGHAGANGVYSNPYPSGGGGGAGTAGSGTSGGTGMSFNISGTSTYYAGGGAGYSYSGAGTPGLGGGGAWASSATANTGGGGGGNNGLPGAGGSGIIIIKFHRP